MLAYMLQETVDLLIYHRNEPHVSICVMCYMCIYMIVCNGDCYTSMGRGGRFSYIRKTLK